ncbi:hypothetical protein [Piscinibacter sp. HJYY11]|uniref:hypothetical protein n=1 Tax=Piscinibacter sp. HJYY11 TaxID=2801333 RepID=UPI00191FD827|nr:hypothetical protein [Piscinibacter sp. HJYY11]MBL0729740.1 hypothetical protein [Piscinibacter sp. HJYY11]
MNIRLALPLKSLVLATALAASLAPALAEAHPRARVGVWIGGPFWWPGYWGPLVVQRPVVVQPPAEPLFVQPSAAQQTHFWYYCREAQMYYPYVTSCPSPWQEVPATTAAEPASAEAPAAAQAPAIPAAPAAAPVPAAAASRTAPAPVPPAPKR